MLEALVEEAQVTVDSRLNNADELCPQHRRGSRLTAKGRSMTGWQAMSVGERWGRGTQHRRGRQLVS